MSQIASTKSPENLRQCFVCEEDEGSDTPDKCVSPCRRCTLSAHNHCALLWVHIAEVSGKPPRCPICELAIELEDEQDLILAGIDAIHRGLTMAKSCLGNLGWFIGRQILSLAYGALALWAFAGRAALMSFIAELEPILGRKNTFAWQRQHVESLGNLVLLSQVSAQLRTLSDELSNTESVLYALWFAHESLSEGHPLVWPPSQEIAAITFPFMRWIYKALWQKFASPLEARWDRKLGTREIVELGEPDNLVDLDEPGDFVGPLLLPVFSRLTGEAAHLVMRALPTPCASALVSKTWVRSLIGGYLFAISRDALRMYVKWRRQNAVRRVKDFGYELGGSSG